MAKPGFYNDNRNRAFPFVKGTVGDLLAAADTVAALPAATVVDAGFVLGLRSGFIDGVHKIRLEKVRRVGDDVYFDFASDAPALVGKPLTFHRSAASAEEYETEHVEVLDEGYVIVSAVSQSVSEGDPTPVNCGCIQLGKSGSFVPSCTGTMRLFLNDDNFADNKGSFTVTINGETFVVPSTEPNGVPGPDVIAGQTYAYTASGLVEFDERQGVKRMCDPDGPTSESIKYGIPGEHPCPGLVEWSLVGKLTGSPVVTPPPPTTTPSETCEGEPLWGGYLVTGRLADLLTVLPGDGEVTGAVGAGLVEPALVQNDANSYIGSVNVGNADRTRVDAPGDCPPLTWPHDTGEDVIFVNASCLRGDIRFKPGYNAIVRQESDTNLLIFGAEVGAGEGQPCDQVPLFDGEVPPAGSALLEGGPRCNEVIRSINGVGGKFAALLGGTGVTVTQLPASNKVVVDVNMGGLAACFASSEFSEVSETL